ncbi:MAG: imidazolonepropionase [Candidatus Cloacimonadales bacterium]
MQVVDKIIINANQLITVSGGNRPRVGKEMSNLGIITDGALAIKDGLIVAVDTTDNILDYYKAGEIIDANDKVVMPGFVDPHTHPIFVHTRENEFEMRIAGKTYVEISLAGGGIRSTIATTKDAPQALLYNLAQQRIRNMISCGTTTMEAKSGYGLDTESELRQLKVISMLRESEKIDIVPTFMGAHEFPAEYKDNHQGYIDILTKEMIPAVAESGLAEYCDIFTEEHVYSIAQSREILKCAKAHGMKLKMHADEIKAIGGAELAAEMGCVSADHLGAASEAGMKAMADKGVIATLLPATIFSLGMTSYANARKMIDFHTPVALASDYNPGSCNCDNMQFVITLACLQMKMTPAEAIVASTINAAHAIGMAAKVGSLEVGKYADVLITDMPSYQYLPYHFGSNNIKEVYKKGELIHKN